MSDHFTLAHWLMGAQLVTLPQEALVACLRAVLRERLAGVGWPPPVSAHPGSSGGSNGLPGSDRQDRWRGLEVYPQVWASLPCLDWCHCAFTQLQRQEMLSVTQSLHAQTVDELNKLLVAFIALQRSVQRSSFEAVRPCLPLRCCLPAQ